MSPESISSSACGCCEGVRLLTPLPTANRPGLDRLAYRIGTHGSFLETMQARLTSLCLGTPDESGQADQAELHPLARLTTRDASDPAMAFLDAWATVADVLTFYQEQIANEGYLRTATEQQSLLELGRLVGYRLKSGVAASVFLAFTLEKDFDGPIPRGTRAQTLPGAGEQPQPFETSEPLEARYEWNSLRPRLTRPQLLADPSTALYVKGTATNLKPNSVLAIEYQTFSEPVAYRVLSVEPQAAYDRTLVEIQRWNPLPVPAPGAVASPLPPSLRGAVLRDLVNDLSSAAGLTSAASGELVRRLAQALQATFAALEQVVAAGPARPQAEQAVQVTVATLEDVRTVLATLLPSLPASSLIAGAVRALDGWAAQSLAVLEPTARPVAGGENTRLARVVREGKVGLGSLVQQMLKPIPLAAVPPQTPRYLPADHQALFGAKSDLLPQLVVGFNPALRTRLYAAYDNAQVTPAQTVKVYAFRAPAAVFGHNAQSIPTYQPLNDAHAVFPPGTVLPQDQWLEWPPDSTDLDGKTLFLDRDYEGVLPDSLVAFQVPDEPMRVVHVSSVDFRSHHAYGIGARTTVIGLEEPWSSFTPDAGDDEARQEFTRFIRHTAVYAQSERLPLAEEPVPDDLSGNTIDLDRVYNGLQPGRWLIVSGEITDLAGTSGVRESELVMLSGVEQIYDEQRPDETPHTRLKLANQLVHTYKLASVTIYGNVINATHGEARSEVLGSGDGRLPFQTFTLRQSPLTYVAAATPSGVASTLVVWVNDVRWHETEDLFQLAGGQRGYITRANEKQETSVTFGNGEYGARLPTGNENIRAVYRNGIGKAGNVPAGQVSQLATRPLGVKSVVNPLRSSGGTDPESRDSARRNIPLALLALDRLVSTQDYADFACTFAGIGKASAARVSNGQTELVYLTIAGVEDGPIDKTSDLYRNLVDAVERFGDQYLPCTIEIREAVLLLFSAGVHVDADHDWDIVSPKIRSALLNAFGFEKRELGQDVLLSELVSVIQSVEGVDYVDANILAGIPEELARDPDALAARMEELAAAAGQPGGQNGESQPQPRVPVRLRPDERAPGQPAGQRLPAQIAYFSPDIPASLLLEEIV